MQDKYDEKYKESMKKNHSTLIDWDRRWLKIRETIVTYNPDIITMQELDKMRDVLPELEKMGYTCRGPVGHATDGKVYVPKSFERRDSPRYFMHLHEAGLAFAPKAPSNAKKFAKKFRSTCQAVLKNNGGGARN